MTPAVDGTSAAADPGTAGQDPVTRWARAAAGLRSARTATYTVTGTLGFSDGDVTFTRRFRVDADAHTLEVRCSRRGGGRGDGDFRVIVAPSGAYARSSSGSTAWHRASPSELAMAGVGGRADDVTVVPEPLRTFMAQSDLGLGELSGEVDALEGMRAAALGPWLLEDKELASSFGGSLYTVLTLDDRGAPVRATIDGSDSTGPDDTSVWGESKQMPERDLVAMYSILDITLTLDSVDKPVDIHVPTRAELR